jgi:hypothetical protein
MLAERMNLERHFRPAHQARALHTLERGYWFLRLPIDTSDPRGAPAPFWSLELFVQFWNYLSTFIAQEGRAGWGVWCICDLEEGAHNGGNDNIEASSGRVYLTVKVFTWGEIAPHIYLLLYLATDKRVKTLPGLEWRDSKEEPVIRMH